jgi:hypothetical protein
MIFPKKPQILYAPMLSTFGGGSARGFGKNLGGSSGIPLTSQLTFDNGNARGNGPLGPTASDLSYATRSDLTSLNFSVDSTGIQSFDVPATGSYDYQIAGASSVRQLYSASGPQYGLSYGKAAYFTGTFTITAADQGKKFFIACGNLPLSAGGYSTNYAGEQASSGNCFNGGGGGTFVGIGTSLVSCSPFLVAGGGGSQRTTYSYVQSELNARTDFVANGNNGGGATNDGGINIGGINGYGGYAKANQDQGTAGAGFYGNADVYAGSHPNGGYIGGSYYSASAQAFINGAKGAIAINVGSSNPQPSGGYGGGGAGGWGGSGGGGGYSGGGSGLNTNSYGYGGGGSNFIDTSKATSNGNPSAVRTGPGYFLVNYTG